MVKASRSLKPALMVHRLLAHRVAGLACLVIAVDQSTKLAAIVTSSGNRSGLIVPLRNSSFSLGVASASLAVTVLVAAVGIVAVGIVAVRRASAGRIPAWVPGLLVGGAVSNLVDRIAFGAVHDFLATPWIVLNLADIAVVAGIVGWMRCSALATRARSDMVS